MKVRRWFRRRLRAPRRFYRRHRRGVLIVFAVAVLGGGTWWLWPDRQPPLAEAPRNYRVLILRYAEKNNLPPDFVHKVVLAESSGRPDAVSRVGAKGLMQIMRPAEIDARKKLGLAEGRGDLFDPEYNIKIGCTYLRMQTDRFRGDAWLVLAAYNMGPTRVSKLAREHPTLNSRELILKHAYKETRDYCTKILGRQELWLPTDRPRIRPTTRPATQPGQ